MAVTFDATLFDAHPNTLRLLTYGSELLTALLEAVPEPASVAPPSSPPKRCPELVEGLGGKEGGACATLLGRGFAALVCLLHP